MKIKPGLILELVVNLVLPWLAYRIAQPHYGDTGALYASAIPPLVWSIVEFARLRRVDALSALVLLGIALSIVMMALGGSPRILLMRESLVSGAIGVAFVASLVLTRPLIFYLARASIARQQPDSVERFETLWDDKPSFRSAMRLMTAVWGGGLVVEMLLRCWFAWNWSIERALVVSPVVSYSIYGVLIFWTFWYRSRLQKQGREANLL